jgi:hypothetical protein
MHLNNHISASKYITYFFIVSSLHIFSESIFGCIVDNIRTKKSVQSIWFYLCIYKTFNHCYYYKHQFFNSENLLASWFIF